MNTNKMLLNVGRRARTLSICVYLCSFVVGFSGCSEFAQEESHRATRSVPSPGDRSAGGDAQNPVADNLNILSVQWSGKKNDPPTVRTIVDDVRDAYPTTAPATRPAAQPSAVTELAPVREGPVRVVAQQHAEDQFRVSTDAEGNATLAVVCPSGIGQVTLELNAEAWPGVVHVQLSKGAGQAFATLEGFNAAEVVSEDKKMPLKTKFSKESPTADVLIPAFVRSSRIEISWVDAYRR